MSFNLVPGVTGQSPAISPAAPRAGDKIPEAGSREWCMEIGAHDSERPGTNALGGGDRVPRLRAPGIKCPGGGGGGGERSCIDNHKVTEGRKAQRPVG
jgi:hypothetical protein